MDSKDNNGYVPCIEDLCHRLGIEDVETAAAAYEHAMRYPGWRWVLTSDEAVVENLPGLLAMFSADKPAEPIKNRDLLSVSEILERYKL